MQNSYWLLLCVVCLSGSAVVSPSRTELKVTSSMSQVNVSQSISSANKTKIGRVVSFSVAGVGLVSGLLCICFATPLMFIIGSVLGVLGGISLLLGFFVFKLQLPMQQSVSSVFAQNGANTTMQPSDNVRKSASVRNAVVKQGAPNANRKSTPVSSIISTLLPTGEVIAESCTSGSNVADLSFKDSDHDKIEADVLELQTKAKKDRSGKTALMLAAEAGNRTVVEALIDKEAGMQDKYGNTALILAAKAEKLECVNVLKGREIGIPNQAGRYVPFVISKSYPQLKESLRQELVDFLQLKYS